MKMISTVTFSKIKCFAITILLVLPCLVGAQEILIPLENQANGSPKKNLQKKASSGEPLELPFIDDFSKNDFLPDPQLWSDSFAHINNTYPINPVSTGVATLDAYNMHGAHYPGAGSRVYIADYLSSQTINLDYNLSDNIFLSFFFQAKGKGEMPDKTDSLCLEFFSPGNEQWNRVWSHPGDTLMENFEQVLIPVNQEIYLQNGFRFRFLNYASQSLNTDYGDQFSNVDHWNIDYVKLDKDRSPSDTLLRDVTFTKSAGSIFKDYEAIPWKHIQAAYFTQRTPTISVQIANRDNLTRNVSRYLEIYDVYNNINYKTTTTAGDIFASEVFDYEFEFDYPFDFNLGDSAKLRMKAVLRTDAVDYKPNDTLTFFQIMNNYYAYDDGSAEAGYGVSGQGSKNASVAVRFNSFKKDSLRAVDMYFNQVLDSINLNYYFYLNVWAVKDGKPGELIYSQLGERPAYSVSLNNPVRYYLDKAVSVEDTFFVGWTKTRDKILNIGFDHNRNNSANNFYNLGNGWLKSDYPGSIILRPVLSEDPLRSILSVKSIESKPLKFYPNPARTFTRLDIPESPETKIHVTITDMKGRLLLDSNIITSENIILTGIEPGIYLIRALRSNTIYTGRLIIQR